MYLFSQEQVNDHFRSIHEGMKNANARVREICLPPLDEIYKTPNALNIFGWPVDHITMGLPDYPEIVKIPMDLGTVKKRIEQSFYRDIQHFASDVNLVFDNAMLYNSKGTYVHDFAKILKKTLLIDSSYRFRYMIRGSRTHDETKMPVYSVGRCA